jgi:hypothetical protein
VQAAQLQHDEEQKEDDGAAGVLEVLPLLPEAHGSSGVEIIAGCGLKKIAEAIRFSRSAMR